MTRPYSNDLRARVAASVVGGRTCLATAALFGVSVASAAKWSRRLRVEGTAAAKPMGGARRAVLASERAWLLARIAAEPDLTLRAIKVELAERGVSVSLWAIWNFYASAGITFKKKHSAGRAGPPRYRKPTASLGLAAEAH
jgi:transposase